MRSSDWSSDVCSSDLQADDGVDAVEQEGRTDARLQGVDLRLRAGAHLRLPAFEHVQVAQHHRGDQRRDRGTGTGEFAEADLARDQVVAERGVELVHQCRAEQRSEEHTSELQSLMRISYAVFCLKKKKHTRLGTT